jgi:triacylglycerol lipase
MIASRFQRIGISVLIALGALLAQSHGALATPPPPEPPDNIDDTHILVFNQNPASRWPSCQYAADGPNIVINIPISRYVGDVDADGHLVAPGALVGNGLLSSQATLRLPAGDVDFGTAAPWPPERDQVFLNGHSLGFLQGAQQMWQYNEFKFDISWLKFPAKGSPGSPPAPADNELRIAIDVLNNPGDRHWCVFIDWVELSFDAMAPIVLVHGVHEDPLILWPAVNLELSAEKIPHASVSLEPDGTVPGNGHELEPLVRGAAKEFGAERVHLVCHSKGGLDSHWYLGNYASDDPRVLSVTTLSSPYQGSVLADLLMVMDAFPLSLFTTRDPDLRTVVTTAWLLNLGNFLARPPGLLDLTTSAAPRLMAESRPPGTVHWASYGANADVNGDLKISLSEALPLPIPSAVGTATYRLMGKAAALSITTDVTLGVRITDIEVAESNPQFFYNDLGVTAVSAHSPEGVYRATLPGNHFSTLSGSVTQDIVSHIKQEFPLRSD